MVSPRNQSPSERGLEQGPIALPLPGCKLQPRAPLPRPPSLLPGFTLVSSSSFSCSSSTFLAKSLCRGWEHASSFAGAWRDPPPGSFRGVGVLQPPGPPLGPQPPPAGSCPRHIGMQPQESGGPRAGLGTGLPREQGAAQGRSQLTASSCIFSSSRAVFLLREISLSALLWVSERGEEFVDREDGAGGLQSQGHPQRSPKILSINWLRQHPAPKPPPSIPAAATGTLETGHGAMGALGRALGAHPSFRML